MTTTQIESVPDIAREAISVDDAYRVCRAIAHRHGANFSVGFRFLPERKRWAVYAAYAFCRWADDIADDPGEGIAERLDDCGRELEACYAGHPGHPITIALADALKHFPIPKDAFVALIDGCRQDTTKSRYANFEELLAYCDLVATSISDISLSIFGYSDPSATRYGRSLATALQLTNVTRDVGDDLARDRIYLPQDEMARFGVADSDIVNRVENDDMRRLIEFQIERAAGYFREAQPLLGMLAFDARFPTVLMGAVYTAVLERLRRNPFAALHERIRLSTAAKVSVVLRRFVQRRFL